MHSQETKNFPPAPALVLKTKDKVFLGVIAVACILTIVCCVAWIGPEMHDFEEEVSRAVKPR